MNATAPHLEFAPPRTAGSLRAMVLAVLAHLVLLAALTMGVQWKSDPVQQVFEAELWSAVPTEAAPPPPAPEPEPVPEPPKPVPVVEPEPVARPDAVIKAEADIALAKEKEKERAKKLKQLALEKQEQEKQRLAELEKQKQEKLKKEQAEKTAHAKQDQQRKQDQQAQLNATKAREDQMKRMEKLAGTSGSGTPSSSGTAAQSSGPSASYGAKLAAIVRKNIVFAETINGNPELLVEVRTAPSGTILSTKVTKSSGVKSYDDAVIRAIEKTETLPRDTDGTIPSVIPFVFHPKD